MYTVTGRDTNHNYGWVGKKFTVPVGTEVTPVDNLPQGGFWVNVEDLPLHLGLNPELKSWGVTYGYHVSESDTVSFDELSDAIAYRKTIDGESSPYLKG